MFYKHKKTNGIYRIIAIATMQAEDWVTDFGNDGAEQVDMQKVVVYQNPFDGTTWVRPQEEFYQRFDLVHIDAFIRNARKDDPVIIGSVYYDSQGRFHDGQYIHTSKIVKHDPKTGIVHTANSVYLTDLIEKEETNDKNSAS